MDFWQLIARHHATLVVKWLIQHLDWEDPLTTKGQRISECITVTGLAHFLREYPDRAPAGLQEKLNAWAKVLVRRSDNLWDFRKLGDDPNNWPPMGEKPTMWNEVGTTLKASHGYGYLGRHATLKF